MLSPVAEYSGLLTRAMIGPAGSGKRDAPPIEIDFVRQIVTKAGLKIRLNKYALKLLTALVEAACREPARPVEYEDLAKRIWPIQTLADKTRRREILRMEAKDPWSDIHGLKRSIRDALFPGRLEVDRYIEAGSEAYRFIGEIWPVCGIPFRDGGTRAVALIPAGYFALTSMPAECRVAFRHAGKCRSAARP